MPISITGLFQPSGGPGSFDLYQPEDIQAGDINVALDLIAGGKILCSGIDGEIKVQTFAGTPTHTASEGTPCWDTTNNKLYVNNNGSTGWTELGAGGGASAIDDLTDVTITGANTNHVLQWNGSAWVNRANLSIGGTTGIDTFDLSAVNDAGGDYLLAKHGSDEQLRLSGRTLTLTGPGANNADLKWTVDNQLLMRVATTNIITLTSAGATVNTGSLGISVTTGTAPLTIASTTLCTNLNADLLDGNHASAFATSGHTHALDDLSDVSAAGPSSGDFLQWSGLAWANFDLFGTANTWTDDQTISDGKAWLFGDTSQKISGDSATDILTITASGASGIISLVPAVAVSLTTAKPMYFGDGNQYVKGTTGSALVEVASLNTSGVLRLNAKSSNDFQIDSTSKMALTSGNLLFNAGTYDVGFGWGADGQLDTVIDNTYVDNWVAIETTHATDGSVGSGVKQTFRGIGLDGPPYANTDIGYNHWYHSNDGPYSIADWKIDATGGSDMYRFYLGTTMVLRMDASQVEFFDKHQFNNTATWVTLNANDVSTQCSISAKSASEVQITTAGTSAPSLIIRPRGLAELAFYSSANTTYTMTHSSGVTATTFATDTTSANTMTFRNNSSGVMTLNLNTAGTTPKVQIASSTGYIGVFGVTAVTRAAAGTDIKDAIASYGWLNDTGVATALNLDGGTLTAGKLVATEWEYAGSMTVDPVSASNTTVTVENTGSGKTTLRVAPNAVASPADSNYAKVGGILYSYGEITHLTSTTTSSEENVLAYTLKAYTFYTAGDTIELRALLTFAANSRTKLIKVKLGSNISVTVMNNATNAADCKALLYARFTRRAGSNMTCCAHLIPTSALATAGAVDTMVYDDTNSDDGASDLTLAISSTISSGQASDVSINDVTIAWYPGQSA